MKNIQAQYQDLLEGRMSKSNFMRNVRMQFPQHISPTTSYDDSVKILKGKRILSEARKPEGVYGHNPNAEAPKEPGIDQLNYYQVYHGIQYELALMPEITDENYVKARKKVVDAILKDPDAYKDLQLANFKAVKQMDKDLEMKDVKKNNLVDKPNEMKVVKKDAKANTEATLEKKEAKKSKTAKVPVMTQAPKAQKGVEAFATPGKETVLREGIKGKFHSDDKTYTYDHLIKTDSPNKEQLAKVMDAIKQDKEELTKKGKKVKQVKGDTVPYLELISDVKALKEHILDELTVPNPHKEHLNKGRVKKKDDSKAGEIVDIKDDTATVKWDDGSLEHVQINVLTHKDVPPKKEIPMPSKPRTMVPWSNEAQEVKPEKTEEIAEGFDARFTSDEVYKYAVRSRYIIGFQGREDILYFKSEQEAKNYVKQRPSTREYLGTKEINEDPIGQQAAGDPEKEKEMRDTLIKKKIKEMLMKAMKKEGYVIQTQAGQTVGSGKDSARGTMVARDLERSTGDELTVVDTKTGRKTQA